MQAYAVMDGGGVKGAALAGCLRAADDAKIEFIGFGGTSAGSIVALLACVGYSGHELCQLMTTELKLSELLKSVKAPLDRLKQLPEDLAGLNWLNVYPTLAACGLSGHFPRQQTLQCDGAISAPRCASSARGGLVGVLAPA